MIKISSCSVHRKGPFSEETKSADQDALDRSLPLLPVLIGLDMATRAPSQARHAVKDYTTLLQSLRTHARLWLMQTLTLICPSVRETSRHRACLHPFLASWSHDSGPSQASWCHLSTVDYFSSYHVIVPVCRGEEIDTPNLSLSCGLFQAENNQNPRLRKKL